MAAEKNNRTVADPDSIGESVSFPHVTAVATGWMLDFMFLSLCRRFKEGKRDDFTETLSAFRGEYSTSARVLAGYITVKCSGIISCTGYD